MVLILTTKRTKNEFNEIVLSETVKAF